MLYGALLRLRNALYDRGGRAVRRASLPVLSVGNITVGGTGKTPFVGWLSRELQSRGRRPAVVSRGYRGRAGRGPLTVSDGRGPVVTADRCGDEPFMLAQTLPGVVVVVGSNRFLGVEAAARLGADVAILDDGFQHRGLARELDIVLLDAGNPFGHDRLLPAGLLREPVRGLKRADVVLITRSDPDDAIATIEKAIREHNTRAPILRAGHRALGLFDGRGEAADPPRRAVAFCGIGNPDRFRVDLESQGLELVAFRAHRDHHPFAAHEIAELHALAAEQRAALITTRKDRTRIGGELSNGLDDPPLLTLEIEVQIHDPGPLCDAVSRALERDGR